MECKQCGYEPTLREIGLGNDCPKCGVNIAAPGSGPLPPVQAETHSRTRHWLILSVIAITLIAGSIYGYRQYKTHTYIDAVQKQISKANYLFKQTIENPDSISNAEHLNRSAAIKAQLEDIRLELYSIDDRYNQHLKSASVNYITKMRSTVAAIDDYVRTDVSLGAQKKILSDILPQTNSESYKELVKTDLDLVNKLTSQEIAKVQRAKDLKGQLEALQSARESAAVGELIVKYRAAEAAVRRADDAKGQASANLQQALTDLSATGAAVDLASGRPLGIGPLRFAEKP
jgi:hypothetical protein